MNYWKIEQSVADAVLGYLSMRPFQEVSNLIDGIMKGSLIQEDDSFKELPTMDVESGVKPRKKK